MPGNRTPDGRGVETNYREQMVVIGEQSGLFEKEDERSASETVVRATTTAIDGTSRQITFARRVRCTYT